MGVGLRQINEAPIAPATAACHGKEGVVSKNCWKGFDEDTDDDDEEEVPEEEEEEDKPIK